MDNDVKAAVGSLWAGTFEAQERRVTALEQAVVALAAGSLDDDGRKAATAAAHKLAGSLGTFGLDEGTRLAAELEEAWPAEPELQKSAIAVMALRKLLKANRPSADPRPRTPRSSAEPP